MGIFDKIKNTFRKNEKEEINDVSSNEIKIYNQGLTKSRENFVSKLVINKTTTSRLPYN